MEVKMEENKNVAADAAEKKLSYEQLNKIANDLFKENQQLRGVVNKLSNNMAIAKLDYLLKIVESSYPFPKEFRDACANEIVAMMTEKEEDTKEEVKEEKPKEE